MQTANITRDHRRRLDIDSKDLDMDHGDGFDGAGFEDPKADTAADELRDGEAVEGVNIDVEGELEKIQGNGDDGEGGAVVKKGEEKKSDKKRNRADLEGTIENKLREGSLSVEQAKTWIKELQDDFDVTQEQLKKALKRVTWFGLVGDCKLLMLKQQAPSVAAKKPTVSEHCASASILDASASILDALGAMRR